MTTLQFSWFQSGESSVSDGNLSSHNKPINTAAMQSPGPDSSECSSLQHACLRVNWPNQFLTANSYNITCRVNDSKTKANCSHQKISWQSRSEAVDGTPSAVPETEGSCFLPHKFVLQSPKATAWI